MVCYSRVCYSINFQFPPHGLDVNKKKEVVFLFILVFLLSNVSVLINKLEDFNFLVV